MSQPAPQPIADTGEVLDLDSARAARAERGLKPQTVRFGGADIAVLPAELPIDVFAPLERFDQDLALLVQQAFNMASGNDAERRNEAASLVIDLFVARPTVGSDMIDAIREMGRLLLGNDGYEAFVAQRPTKEDIGEFVKAVFKRYGVSLGESPPSSDSSEPDGETSKPTLPTTTPALTSEASTTDQATPDSSEPAA